MTFVTFCRLIFWQVLCYPFVDPKHTLTKEQAQEASDISYEGIKVIYKVLKS